MNDSAYKLPTMQDAGFRRLTFPEMIHRANSGPSTKAAILSERHPSSSVRTVEPVVLMLAKSGKRGSPGMRGFPRVKSLDGSSLFFMVQPFLDPIGIGSSVLRPLLTSALPSPAYAGLFLAFSRRDDLLPGAAQISQDKSIDFLCASSPFTKSLNRQ